MKAKHEFKTEQEYQEYLRVYFAAMAMQGMMNNANWITDIELVSERATVFADALITSLNQPI